MMMKQNLDLIEGPKTRLSMHPKKFALWLFIGSVVMMFAAFTSAFIVRRAEGNWMDFEIPDIFWLNTGIVLLSSGTMHWAFTAAKRDDLETIKLALGITIILGFAFLTGQYISWGHLVDANVFFVGNPAGSFLYVLTGLHGFHIVTGITFLVVVLLNTIRYNVHAKNLVQIEMCTTYWHFLSGLWLYLFIFLLLNH